MIKNLFLTLLFLLACNISFAQDKTNAEKLVKEGIALHDKGEYDAAIIKYDQALTLDQHNLFALGEKAFSLLAQEKYKLAVAVAELALKEHENGDEGVLRTLYVTYGNALDMLGKTKESIAVYDVAIKKFPNEQMLYFNKAISLYGAKQYQDAFPIVQQSLMLNPKHAGSNNLAGLIALDYNNPIGAILAFGRFLSIEPTGNRAASISKKFRDALQGDVSKTGEKTININLNASALNDKGKPKENSFSTAYMALSMSAALAFDEKYKNETEVQQTLRKLESICAALKLSQKENYGFYWTYYVPYFLEMKEKNHLETFAYISLITKKDQDVNQWLSTNESKIKDFFDWSESFKWKTN